VVEINKSVALIIEPMVMINECNGSL